MVTAESNGGESRAETLTAWMIDGYPGFDGRVSEEGSRGLYHEFPLAESGMLSDPASPEIDPARPVDLSAHHALCVHGFRGMGYSPGFVASLGGIIAALRANPGAPVRVRVGADAVCRACPSLGAGGCLRYGMGVVRQDSRVAARLGVAAGEVMPWAELQARVRDHVGPDDLADLCGGCPWLEYGVCAAGISDLVAGRETPAG